MSVSQTVQEESIPSSFTTSVDRPFEPVGVRDLTEQLYDRNNERLTDEQIQSMLNNPQPAPNPNARIDRMTREANAELSAEFESEKIYNLSVSEVAKRTTKAVHDILDDVVTFNVADGPRGFIQIFIQSDRLMYVGIIVIVITMLLMLLKMK